jgi:hypothetical protein
MAPKAKQKTITEQEIMAETKQKAVPVQYLPSAQPYIAPPPKVSAQEIMAAATSKAVPKAQDVLATQTSKAVPKAQDVLATQTSKAKPKAQEPPSLPRPPPPREERTSSLTDKNPEQIYRNFMSKFKEYLLSKTAETRGKIIQQATPIHLQEMFMDEGKRWGVIENQATRKWPTVVQVFDLLDKNGQGDLHIIMQGIFEETLLRPDLARASSSTKGSGKYTPKAKAKTTSRATKKYIVYDKQPMIQPQPVATGSGKHRRQKVVSRLKPIKEDEEVVELIKPAKTHLSYLDFNNDPLFD